MCLQIKGQVFPLPEVTSDLTVKPRLLLFLPKPFTFRDRGPVLIFLSITNAWPHSSNNLVAFYFPPPITWSWTEFWVVFFFFFAAVCRCRILVPWPGIQPMPPALGAQRLSRRPTREVPTLRALEGLGFIPTSFPAHCHTPHWSSPGGYGASLSPVSP